MEKNLDNPNTKNNKILIIVIVILSILLVGGGCYFAYDKFITNANNKEKNNDNINENKENDNKQEDIKYNDFSFANFNINLINRLDSINDIYAFDIKNNKDSDKANDIVARYKNDKTVRLATVSQKLDYRILDISDNKVYFLVLDNDSTSTNLFELYYIDLNNLDKGAIILSDFNEVYKKESEFCISSTGNCRTYSTQIYVKNNLIYYSAFKTGTIKTYNISTKETKTVINEKVYWSNYLVDKANNKIFFESANDHSLYLINLDGSNKIKLDNEISRGGSAFWRNDYLNNSPIFAGGKDDDENIGCGPEECIYNLYKFDYSNNAFVEIKDQVGEFTINFNEIILTRDSNIINTFYVIK